MSNDTARVHRREGRPDDQDEHETKRVHCRGEHERTVDAPSSTNADLARCVRKRCQETASGNGRPGPDARRQLLEEGALNHAGSRAVDTLERGSFEQLLDDGEDVGPAVACVRLEMPRVEDRSETVHVLLDVLDGGDQTRSHDEIPLLTSTWRQLRYPGVIASRHRPADAIPTRFGSARRGKGFEHEQLLRPSCRCQGGVLHPTSRWLSHDQSRHLP